MRRNYVDFKKSEQLYKEASTVIPGGVNSPVRAFNAVGNHPVFVASGEGSHVRDVDGNELIDYVCSWGPLILGHGDPEIQEAMFDAMKKGTTFGMPTAIEVEMAKKITELVSSIDRIRMVSSGTEATMSAIRLARGFTGRDKIVKFRGCYHGHVDYMLIEAGSGAMTFGVPSTPGVPDGAAKETVLAEYNNIDSVEEIFAMIGYEVAAIIVEPIAGNMGLVPGHREFLSYLRDITQKYGSLLIFDEVISGFRSAIGGAQELYNIVPDITCFGKIIGGGLPVGAFGGKSEVMQFLSPVGPVYQAGTLSGNPLAMQAGLKTLEILERDMPYAALNAMAEKLADGLQLSANKYNVPVFIRQKGSLLTVFFTDVEVVDHDTAQTANKEAFSIFFQEMLKQGIHLPPAQFECWFISTKHTEEDLMKTLVAADQAFAAVARSGIL